jgi:hypothetical protein
MASGRVMAPRKAYRMIAYGESPTTVRMTMRAITP